MDYISTRGLAPAVNSVQALLNGLAPDGGLYVPAQPLQPLPPGADFRSTMEALLARFFDDIPEAVRRDAVATALARFRSPEVVPLSTFGDVSFLELFHGPTYAFKDIALTLLPQLMRYAATQAGIKQVGVLTATSGDTGSAAMHGFADVPGTQVLVFYPQVGTSEIQRKQMVCCPGGNVSACAIAGNFDDAQTAVKAAFADATLKARAAASGCLLSSANSINIGRLFPQICYYLDCARKLGGEAFDVVVPTGNFGNILAAVYARELGAPIGRLEVASNTNRVVCDFVRTGLYDTHRAFQVTNSPSMDILVSSNVERLLWSLTGGNAVEVRTWEAQLKAEGAFQLSPRAFHELKQTFASGWATPEETEAAIREVWERHAYLVDPHTAVGWKVHAELPKTGRPAVIAATASPWKFPTTMLRALSGKTLSDEFAAADALAAYTGRTPALTELRTEAVRFEDVAQREQVPEAIVRAFHL